MKLCPKIYFSNLKSLSNSFADNDECCECLGGSFILMAIESSFQVVVVGESIRIGFRLKNHVRSLCSIFLLHLIKKSDIFLLLYSTLLVGKVFPAKVVKVISINQDLNGHLVGSNRRCKRSPKELASSTIIPNANLLTYLSSCLNVRNCSY